MNRTHYLFYTSMIFTYCMIPLHGIDELNKAQEFTQKKYEEIKRKLTLQTDSRELGIVGLSSATAFAGVIKFINGKHVRGGALVTAGIMGILATPDILRRWDQRK